MLRFRTLTLLLLMLASAIAVAACGGDDDDDGPTAERTATAGSGSATTSAAGTPAPSDLEALIATEVPGYTRSDARIIPAGATVFPEGNIGSMITGAIVLQYQELEIPNLVFTAGFVIGILVSFVGAYVTVIDRKLNGYILELTLQAVRKGRFSKITWLDMLSILIYFLLMSLLAFIALTLAGWAMPWLQSALGVFESNLRLVKPAVWGLGIALTLPMIYRALWPGR